MIYQDYLDYLGTLEGMARYPLTVPVEEPPDLLYEYRRPMTEDEWHQQNLGNLC
jgi:hypothetical protein